MASECVCRVRGACRRGCSVLSALLGVPTALVGGRRGCRPKLQLPRWVQRELAAANAREAPLHVAFEVRHAHCERGGCLLLAEQHLRVLRRCRSGCLGRH